MTQYAELYDGTTLEFPDDTSPDVIAQVAKRETNRRRVSSVPEKPASVSLGEGLREVPRQVGLAARYGIEGVLGLPAAAGNVAGTAINGYLEMADQLAQKMGRRVDFRFPEQNAAVSDALTRIGLPQPQNANERVIGDASRLLAGSGSVVKGAQMAQRYATPAGRRMAEELATNPQAQAAAAVGAGVAGGSVREAGGGPTEQFIASVIGGIASPFAASRVVRAGHSTAASARAAVAPKDIQGVINVELQRANIDWNALTAEAQAQLVKDAQKAVALGEALDPQALARLAHFRNIGATPLRGDVTMDPIEVTRQRNLAKTQANGFVPPGAPNLSAIQNENARAVLSTIDNIEASPMDATAAGARVIQNIADTDASLKAGENALYSAARDSAGRNIPLDRSGFVTEAFNNLQNSQRGGWLPSQVREILNSISDGTAPFDVNTIDMLKTLLAQESRATTNGNVRMAISDVRNALENVQPAAARAATGSQVPVTGAMGARLAGADVAADSVSAETLGKFDAARAAARQRRTWQESAPFIQDAIDGIDPEKFVRKHVVGGELANQVKLRTEIKNDAEAIGAVRKQLIEYIKKRSGASADTTTYGSKSMEDAFNQIGKRKFRVWFTEKEVQQLESAIKVARYMDAQPKGSAVNNSNSGAMVIGKALETLLGASTGVPFVGPMIAKPLIGAKIGLEARSAANVPNALMLQMPPEPFPTKPLLLLSAGIPGRDQ